MTKVVDLVTPTSDSPTKGDNPVPATSAGTGAAAVERQSTVEAYVERFGELDKAAGPQWLSDLRETGIENFARLGFPTRKNEDWHFTNVAPIAEREFKPLPAPAEGTITSEQIKPFLFEGEWSVIVFVNGHFSKELSSFHRGNGRYFISTLNDAIANEMRHIEQKLGGLAKAEGDAFTALNAAFVQDGIFVGLSPNAVLETPIHVIHINDENAESGLVSPRTLIMADHHSEATVVESFVSVGKTGPAFFSNAVAEVYLAPGARVRHYKVQRQNISSYHVSSAHVYQQADSDYESFSFAVGADLSRTNVDTILDGEGSHVTMNGLYMVDGTQVVDHQTRVEHVAPNCTSHEIYKGILDGASQGVFNGKVYVHSEAQKTDGKQSNNNLILSDKAEVNTKPQLEIYADDVRCTHGATIGRLDDEALFYLKSRGVGAATARKLLTYAFAAEVMEEMSIESVKDGLEGLTFTRFAE